MDGLERAPFRANNSPPVVVSDHTSDETPVDLLIASDDNKLRDVVNAALRKARCTGTFVRSGRDVVRRVARQRTPLLLLDQCLRGLGGLAVAQRLSARTRPRFVLFGENLTTP